MIVIDSDVFILDILYPVDPRTETNKGFLAQTRFARATTIFNVLEVCGLVSFNKTLEDLRDLFHRFHETYRLQILYPQFASPATEDVLQRLVTRTFTKIIQKMTFGDAVILATAESARAEMFVTWNIRHFEGRTTMQVLTPEVFLNRHTT